MWWRRSGTGLSGSLSHSITHTYKNVGATPAKFLTLMSPNSLEGFCDEVGKPGDGPQFKAAFGEEDIEMLLAAITKHGGEILPPPEA